MTDINYADIRNIVDLLPSYEFDKAAVWAANRLEHDRHAYVILQPGDGTAYRILLIAPDGEMWSHGPQPDHRYYHVALSFGLGYGYDWTGYEIDPGYVVQKWTRDMTGSDYHTACVLTRFLNALAKEINP